MATLSRVVTSTASVEGYLKAIFSLSGSCGGNRSARVCTTDLAERVGVSPASATVMMQRLARCEEPLLDYVPYQGVLLTSAGERAALRVVRRHRLLELFLTERLGLHPDEVHAEAERLEHHISADLEERIAAALGEPLHDPHGQPIPTVDG